VAFAVIDRKTSISGRRFSRDYRGGPFALEQNHCDEKNDERSA
jgi:hypothetical protein